MIDGLMNLGEHALFATVMEAERAMLESSPLGGLLPGEKVADLFCGEVLPRMRGPRVGRVAA